MKLVTAVAFLQLFSSFSVAVSGDVPTETDLQAGPGDVALLPCYTSSDVPPGATTWRKDGREVAADSRRISVEPSGTLRITDVRAEDEGSYLCNVTLPGSMHFRAHVLLQVAKIPNAHPDCTVQAQNSSHLRFICSWFGAHPSPELRWGKDDFSTDDNITMTINGSLLHDSQTLTCTARHVVLGPKQERQCSITVKNPYPTGEPLATAVKGSNTTLTCTESTSIPQANTMWRGLKQEPIVSGDKYIVTQESTSLKLTIINVSKDDEGDYYCISKNQIQVTELVVFLTVKESSSAYTGAIIGVFIAVLIVGSALIIAKILYSRRHMICLGGGFESADSGDVVSLVESDDERIFQDTVPKLPPVANGNHTTLVQIHQIPSSDHEEAEPADANQEQADESKETATPEDFGF